MSVSEFSTHYLQLAVSDSLGFEGAEKHLAYALQGYGTTEISRKFPEPGTDAREAFGIVACGVCEGSICSNMANEVKEKFKLPSDSALYAFETGVHAAIGASYEEEEEVAA